MEQIEVTDEALPILRSGIALKERLLNMKADNYLKRLQEYEKKYKMKNAEFSKAFSAGEIGDDADWFDWIFVYEAYNKITRQIKIIESLSL